MADAPDQPDRHDPAQTDDDSDPERGYPPKRAKKVAAALVDSLAHNREDRLFCRRLSFLPPRRWTDSMVDWFDQLTAVHRPDLSLRPSLTEGLSLEQRGTPHEDAKRVEREFCSLMRPYVRVSNEGLLWVGPLRNADEHTMHVTKVFNTQFVETAMWLVAPEDEEAVVRYASERGLVVSAGAAEHVAASVAAREAKSVFGEQLSLLDDPPPPPAPSQSLPPGSTAGGDDDAGSAAGQGAFLLDDPEVPQPPLVVDFDGQSVFVDGDITPATREHLKRVVGIEWNGRECRWVIAPVKAQALFDAADVNGWDVTDDARSAHHDAMERVKVREVEIGRARERSRALTPTSEIVVPGLNNKFVLRPYQQAGIETAVALRRAILADDVGLGKTVQALSSVALTETLPVIVVAKASLKLNWHHEITELFGWSTHIVEGRTPEKLPDVDVIIINPDLLKARLSDLQDVEANALIVDESHFLSNPRSQRSKALRTLARPIRKREGLLLSLTATLMPNGKAMEVYPQLDMLGFLGRNSPFAVDWDSFGRKYAAGYQAYGRLVVDTPIDDPDRGHLVQEGLLKLNADLETHCMVRRSKRDAQPDLPAAQISPVYLDVDKKLWGKYQQAEVELAEFLAERAAEIAAELGKDPRSAAVRAKLLLELSGHEQLQSHNALTQLAVAAKFAEMVDWVDTFLTDNPDEKLLVFAHNRAVQMALAGLPIPAHNESSIQIVDWEKTLAAPLEHAREVAERFQVGTILANSDQKAQSVEEDKQRFQTDPGCRLMVLSLGAGSEGHTLTAAWHVAFAQLPMTAKAFRQAVGRAYGRMNDPHSVWVHPLMATDGESIDHDTLRRIGRKGAALDAVQDGVIDAVDLLDADTAADSPGGVSGSAAESLLDVLDRHQK